MQPKKLVNNKVRSDPRPVYRREHRGLVWSFTLLTFNTFSTTFTSMTVFGLNRVLLLLRYGSFQNLF